MVVVSGAMVSVEVLVAAGKIRVMAGKGINVVVGVMVGLAEGVCDLVGVPVPWVSDGELVLVVPELI